MSAPEYAYLAIGRAKVESVTLPDGSTTLVDPGAGIDVLREWYAKCVEPAADSDYERSVAAWESERNAFVAATTIEEVDVKRDVGGFRKVTATVDRVTFPDGETKEVDRGTGEPIINARFKQHTPRPSRQATDFETWRRDEQAHAVETVTTWRATLYTNGNRRPLDLGTPRDWSYGAPLAEIVHLLSQLSSEGWEVVQVAEDKGIYAGVNANDESAPVRLRYLLANQRGGR